MDKENTENLDSQKEDVQVEDVPEPSTDDKEQFTDREKQYYERIKKLEQENKELKTPKEEPEEKPKPEKKEKDLPESPALSLDQKVELRMDGYSKEEIAFIERNLGDRSIDDTLEDPFVKSGINSMREAKKSEDDTPAPSSNVPTFTPEKKKWESMTHEERAANYQKAIQALKSKGTRGNE